MQDLALQFSPGEPAPEVTFQNATGQVVAAQVAASVDGFLGVLTDESIRTLNIQSDRPYFLLDLQTHSSDTVAVLFRCGGTPEKWQWQKQKKRVKSPH